MVLPKLGTLITLRATEVWLNEPHAFTPWLADNLSLLAVAIQIGDLELKGTEVSAGDFRLDLLAQDEEGNAVLVENQFGPTDHRHLGQIITYLASQGRKATVVWIAEKFRDEHRAAIDWLNSSTIPDFDFFAVEIEALRIGDSLPAPFFNVVAKPNRWTRDVSRTARRLSSEAGTDRQAFYLEYWAAFRETYIQFSAVGAPTKKPSRNRYDFRLGRSGFKFVAIIDTSERRIRFGLVLAQRGLLPKEAYRVLEAEKVEIDSEAGMPLIWSERPDITASRIEVYLTDTNVENREDWPRQFKWILDMLILFRAVFVYRIRAMKLSREVPSDEDADNEEESS